MSRARPIVVVIIFGTLLRVGIAWAPFDWLLRYVLSDDAFYYFTIARNAVNGYGITFDRLAETNGFHPLWLAIILPVQALVSDRILAIHAMLSISAACDVVSLSLLWMLLKEWNVGQSIRLVLCFLYSFSPIILSHAGPLSGLEIGLNVMLTFAFLISYSKFLKRDSIRLSHSLSFGAISALLFLARTDNIVLMVVSYVHLLIRTRSQWTSFRQILIATFITTIAVAPWLCWSYMKFDSVIQVSGLSIAYATKFNLASQGWTIGDYAIQFVRNLAGASLFFPVYLSNTPILSLFPLLTLAIVGVSALVCIFILRSKSRQAIEFREYGVVFIPMALVLLLFVLTHTLRAAYLRGWYYTSLYPIMFLLTGIAIRWLSKIRIASSRQTRVASRITLVVLLCSYIVALHRVSITRIGESDKYQVLEMMNTTLREGSRVGSWNAGVYGYFFERGEIVNLDGLVNNLAYERIKKRSLREYCRKVGITHLVDPRGSFELWQPFWEAGARKILTEGKVLLEMRDNRNDNRSLVVLELNDR